MIKINKADLRDKIYACWIGKNIGGTMGGPFEGTEDLLDIEGFTTPEGTVLPNDDLDLQLIWLKALEERGPKAITSQLLGEYWLNFIPPTWNEYGIGKSNLIMGLLPPLSGEYANYWKDSNGAWIRSEIWACCAPGCPDVAIQYALEDAMVDHGMSEGTYAEIFTAAVESAAFVCNDLHDLIKIGLSKIPPNCRVAQSVRTVVECHRKGQSWQEARERVLKDNRDLGWFQAPGNIAFTVIGLLYGAGDFKKSMIIAINCGDDTDCTGATCGALLGIMGGTAAVPADWRKYIGDNIITVAINRGDVWGMPQSCTELTNRILNLTPQVLYAHRCNDIMLTDEPMDLSGVDVGALCNPDIGKRLCNRPAWSYDVEFIHTKARVSFKAEPKVEPNGEIYCKINLISCMPDPRNIMLKWHLPEGWTVKGPGSVYLRHWYNQLRDTSTAAEFVITAGENVEPLNRLVVEAIAPGRPTVGYIPVTILG